MPTTTHSNPQDTRDRNNVNYRHFRCHDESGNLKNKGGITIAYRETENGYLEIASSRCSEKDAFCYKTGRIIAQGRLQSGRCAVADVTWEQFNDKRYQCIIADSFGTVYKLPNLI